ncbi:MAG: hypothetical protein JNL40_07415 [Cyclobacteriaceae bacterium]|nr:hypothetical protein [Cyclobacteriaceae bacterium]
MEAKTGAGLAGLQAFMFGSERGVRQDSKDCKSAPALLAFGSPAAGRAITEPIKYLITSHYLSPIWHCLVNKQTIKETIKCIFLKEFPHQLLE